MRQEKPLGFKGVGFLGIGTSDLRADDLADEIAAMANTSDGMLVFGVDDKTREVIGIPLGRLDFIESRILRICEEIIRPPVSFRAYRMELPDASGTPQPILKVEIPRSLFVHESPGGYFQRQGSSKRKMPPDVLARLFQQRSQARLIRFEEQTVPETTAADLNESLWRRFVGEAGGDENTILRKMKLLADDESGRERVTVTGILLCAREPQRWLPGAFIQAVRYRGTAPDANYQLDASQIVGPLDAQIHGALSFVRRNMTVAARKDPARVELPQYSIRAVFEAIVNAVAHRDYSVHGSKVRLLLFDDRLELFSPGPLPNTVTIDSIALRQATRNELITTLLSKCAFDGPAGEIGRRFLMEKRGEGVPIILKESRQLSGRDPVYQVIDDAEVFLTIWAPSPST
jgi:predicted HTH transcriptional regulator